MAVKVATVETAIPERPSADYREEWMQDKPKKASRLRPSASVNFIFSSICIQSAARGKTNHLIKLDVNLYERLEMQGKRWRTLTLFCLFAWMCVDITGINTQWKARKEEGRRRCTSTGFLLYHLHSVRLMPYLLLLYIFLFLSACLYCARNHETNSNKGKQHREKR